MIDLDSSALLKLVFEAPESAALGVWIAAQHATPMVSSALATIDVSLAVRRLNLTALPAARALLDGLDLIPMSAGVVRRAADVEGPGLRTLDAIHLASALHLGDARTPFVADDHRLLEAATAAGVATSTP